MTEPTEEDLEVVASAADKVERRLLHVPFAELLDNRSRELLLELAKKVV